MCPFCLRVCACVCVCFCVKPPSFPCSLCICVCCLCLCPLSSVFVSAMWCVCVCVRPALCVCLCAYICFSNYCTLRREYVEEVTESTHSEPVKFDSGDTLQSKWSSSQSQWSYTSIQQLVSLAIYHWKLIFLERSGSWVTFTALLNDTPRDLVNWTCWKKLEGWEQM